MNGRLLHEFERQQGSGLAQSLLTEVMRQLTTMQIPDAWAGQLAPGQQAETRMAKTMVHILGRGWHETQPAQQSGDGSTAPPSAADEEAAAWTAWAAATDPYARAAMFGLPMFLAARAWSFSSSGGDTSAPPTAACEQARQAPGSGRGPLHAAATGLDRRERQSSRISEAGGGSRPGWPLPGP